MRWERKGGFSYSVQALASYCCAQLGFSSSRDLWETVQRASSCPNPEGRELGICPSALIVLQLRAAGWWGAQGPGTRVEKQNVGAGEASAFTARRWGSRGGCYRPELNPNPLTSGLSWIACPPGGRSAHQDRPRGPTRRAGQEGTFWHAPARVTVIVCHASEPLAHRLGPSHRPHSCPVPAPMTPFNFLHLCCPSPTGT